MFPPEYNIMNPVASIFRKFFYSYKALQIRTSRGWVEKQRDCFSTQPRDAKRELVKRNLKFIVQRTSGCAFSLRIEPYMYWMLRYINEIQQILMISQPGWVIAPTNWSILERKVVLLKFYLVKRPYLRYYCISRMSDFWTSRNQTSSRCMVSVESSAVGPNQGLKLTK